MPKTYSRARSPSVRQSGTSRSDSAHETRRPAPTTRRNGEHCHQREGPARSAVVRNPLGHRRRALELTPIVSSKGRRGTEGWGNGPRRDTRPRSGHLQVSAPCTRCARSSLRRTGIAHAGPSVAPPQTLRSTSRGAAGAPVRKFWRGDAVARGTGQLSDWPRHPVRDRGATRGPTCCYLVAIDRLDRDAGNRLTRPIGGASIGDLSAHTRNADGTNDEATNTRATACRARRSARSNCIDEAGITGAQEMIRSS
jgi:hypothetical protein